LTLGATLIDTAENYGSEDVVGEAIREKRDHVFLATKVSGEHLRYEQVLRAADASLKRLGTSVIDLYQVHWPDPRVPIAETMKAMGELVDARKVRHIGVSNFSRHEFEEAQAALPNHPIVSNQVDYSLLVRGVEDDFEFYRRAGVTVIAYSPLARGDLAHFDSNVLREVAGETGKTAVQVALRWCLAHLGVIVIPKTDRADRVDELAGASGWELSPDQLARLNRVF
jgi:diketogulonate reductase-like aldo/keto reductase